MLSQHKSIVWKKFSNVWAKTTIDIHFLQIWPEIARWYHCPNIIVIIENALVILKIVHKHWPALHAHFSWLNKSFARPFCFQLCCLSLAECHEVWILHFLTFPESVCVCVREHREMFSEYFAGGLEGETTEDMSVTLCALNRYFYLRPVARWIIWMLSKTRKRSL